MRIEIGQGDGFLFADKIVRNVIVTVITDDNKRITFPYAADRSLADLYKSAEMATGNAVPGPAPRLDTLTPKPEPISGPDDTKSDNNVTKAEEDDTSNEIQRGDIVRCIRVIQADIKGENAPEPDLAMGKEYRVLKVNKSVVADPTNNGKMISIPLSYELVDDSSSIPRRLLAYPGDIELVKKASKGDEKILPLCEIFKCPACQSENALQLDVKQNKYVGPCDRCKAILTFDRPVKKDKEEVNA